MRYSHSRINTYETCELKFFLRYIQGLTVDNESIPRLVGDLFHQTASVYNSGGGDLDAAINCLTTLYNIHLENPDDDKDSIDRAFMKVREAITLYDQVAIPVFASEVDVTKHYGDHEYYGIIDGLTWYKDDIWIVEYKTGNVNLDFYTSFDWQSKLYAWLIEAVGTIFVAVNTSVQKMKLEKHITFHPVLWTKTEIEIALDICEKRVYNIENEKNWLPKRTYNCTWCDYKEYCRAKLAGA